MTDDSSSQIYNDLIFKDICMHQCRFVAVTTGASIIPMA